MQNEASCVRVSIQQLPVEDPPAVGIQLCAFDGEELDGIAFGHAIADALASFLELVHEGSPLLVLARAVVRTGRRQGREWTENLEFLKAAQTLCDAFDSPEGGTEEPWPPR